MDITEYFIPVPKYYREHCTCNLKVNKLLENHEDIIYTFAEEFDDYINEYRKCRYRQISILKDPELGHKYEFVFESEKKMVEYEIKKINKEEALDTKNLLIHIYADDTDVFDTSSRFYKEIISYVQHFDENVYYIREAMKYPYIDKITKNREELLACRRFLVTFSIFLPVDYNLFHNNYIDINTLETIDGDQQLINLIMKGRGELYRYYKEYDVRKQEDVIIKEHIVLFKTHECLKGVSNKFQFVSIEIENSLIISYSFADSMNSDEPINKPLRLQFEYPDEPLYLERRPKRIIYKN